jgi:hypothetical protein
MTKREDETREYPFDELARGVADGTLSRGSALRSVGAAILGGLLSIFALPRNADAQTVPQILWTKVKADGTLVNGSGVKKVIVGGGGYFVRFKKDISNCAYVATAGETNTAYSDPGEAQAAHSTGAGSPDRDVFVAFSDTDTGALSRGFSLVVTC